MPQHNIVVRTTQPHDGPALNDLYRRLTGIPRTLEQWRWEWFEGPEGPSPSWVIVDENDRVLGHHGVVPVPLLYQGRRVKAARTENTMIDPDARKRFLYLPIEAKLLEELMKQFDVIFTTSGKRTHGEVRKRLGYTSVGPWHTFHLATTPLYIARRIAGRLFRPVVSMASFASSPPPSPWAMSTDLSLTEIARHCEGWCNVDGIAPERSASALKWRLQDHPYHPIKLGLLRNEGTAEAFIAWQESHGRGGTNEVSIEDICTRKSTVDGLLTVFRAFSGLWRRTPTRISLRTLDNERPLAAAARQLDKRRRAGAAGAAELLVKSKVPLGQAWDATLFLAQGI